VPKFWHFSPEEPLGYGGGKQFGGVLIRLHQPFRAILVWLIEEATNGADSAAIANVTVDGTNVTIESDNGQGRYTVQLAFVRDTFSGTYTAPAVAGTIHGRRVARHAPNGKQATP
jgi:hypothetical protein